MSLRAWMSTYYREPAFAVSRASAVSHTLLFWRGLRRHVRWLHGLRLVGTSLIDNDGQRLSLTKESTSLCYHHLGNQCVDCPLALARDGAACFEQRIDERCAPFHALTRHGRARPMLFWLKKADKIRMRLGGIL